MGKTERKFVSAAQSVAHRLFRSEAARHGYPLSTIREVLCVINADPELIGFPIICEHLKEMIASMLPKWGINPANWRLDLWLPLLQWTVDHRCDLKESIGTHFDPEDAQINPMLGNGVGRHPVYTAFLCSHLLSEHQTRYRLLQAHLLAAIIKEFRTRYPLDSDVDQACSAYEAHDAAREWKPFPNSPGKAAVSVRKLSSKVAPYPGYLSFLNTETRPADFAAALPTLDLQNLSSNKFVRLRHRQLRYFLEKVFGSRTWVDRNVKRGKRRFFGADREAREIQRGILRRELEPGGWRCRFSSRTLLPTEAVGEAGLL